ncbi:MAG TPA: alpha/beta hydrolase [Albitalea sp.]|uniref:alpha/beta hydrolase n=1 Tax=Piscinibacter sp. TaxID=1903157 RepID=UPI002ED24323
MSSSPAWNEASIACGCAEALPARIYRPTDVAAASAPLVLHLHGGAFVGGDLEAGRTVAALIADAGAVVVSLDYPLAPDHPFPQAIEAVHAAADWAMRHRRRLAGAQSPLFVAGEEAGGNLAAAAALMARDRHGPDLAGQILLSPMLDVCVGTASLRGAHAGPVGCAWADGWRQYLPRASDALHPYAAPASSMRLEGLPPTLLVTADDDPLRDETRAYAQRLRDAGVTVDEAVVPAVTGWPRSYRSPAAPAAPWPAMVSRRLQRFLSQHATAAA